MSACDNLFSLRYVVCVAVTVLILQCRTIAIYKVKTRSLIKTRINVRFSKNLNSFQMQ